MKGIILAGGSGTETVYTKLETVSLSDHLSGQTDLRRQFVHAGTCYGQPEFPLREG